MNFIDRSSENIAKHIRKHYADAGSEAALKYSLTMVINLATSISVSLIVSLITGHFLACLTGIFCYTFIRSITGGLHTSTSLSCCILSILIFVGISFVNFEYNVYFIIIDLLSIIIFLITAPNDIENMSRIDPKYYPLLKIIAVLAVSSNFFIQSSVLTASFVFQAILTTKPAHSIKDYIEGR